MRILVASDQWFPDLKGGAARVATETAVRLADLGHDVTVIVPRAPGLPTEERKGRLTVRRVIARSAVPKTISDVVQTAIHARRASGRFDLLVAHQCTNAVGLLAARLDAPLALVFHASVTRELRFLRSTLPRGPRRLSTYALELPLAALERAAVRRADTILILSEFSRSILEEVHGAHARRARRVPGGVDTDAFSPGDGRTAARQRLLMDGGTRDLLLTVRRLEPRMGLEQLLRAVALLPDRPILTVVGGGTLDESLRRLASELGLSESVRFTGRVADDVLRDWYRAADLFVLPTVAYEGFGMATAEALASGTPVVGTPVGATPELLEPLDPRLVARGTDPEALAAGITVGIELARSELRDRCRPYACEQFGWEPVMVGWERELLETAEKARRGGAAA